MSSQVILFLLVQLVGSVSEPEICPFSVKEMELPIREPRMLVVDKKGKVLAPSRSGRRLEFSQLKVHVPVIQGATETYWVPTGMAQAAIGFKVMLPSDFYARLLRGYDGAEKRWTIVDDPATSERWDDLVSFVDRIWGTRWSGEKNPYEQVRSLINYSMRTDVHVPSSCGA